MEVVGELVVEDPGADLEQQVGAAGCPALPSTGHPYNQVDCFQHCCIVTTMPTWSHSRPEVRRALNEAKAAGLKVQPTTSHGHSWGYIDCVDPDCGNPLRRLYVNSTPQDQDNEANRIRRFIRRHEHQDKKGVIDRRSD